MWISSKTIVFAKIIINVTYNDFFIHTTKKCPIILIWWSIPCHSIVCHIWQRPTYNEHFPLYPTIIYDRHKTRLVILEAWWDGLSTWPHCIWCVKYGIIIFDVRHGVHMENLMTCYHIKYNGLSLPHHIWLNTTNQSIV